MRVLCFSLGCLYHHALQYQCVQHGEDPHSLQCREDGEQNGKLRRSLWLIGGVGSQQQINDEDNDDEDEEDVRDNKDEDHYYI